MSDYLFDGRIERAARDIANEAIRPIDAAAIAETAIRAARRPSTAPRLDWRLPRTWAVAAAMVIAVLAVGGLFYVNRPDQPAVGDPSPTSSASPSPSPSPSLPAVVGPSSIPSGPSAGPTSSAAARPKGAWIATGAMHTARVGHIAVRLLDGRVLVAGGSIRGQDGLTSGELYDPDSGTWSATGNMLNMLNPRGTPATLLRNGKVLVVDIDGAELYDPASGTWTATGEMVNGEGSTATLLRDGRVLVIGYDDIGELYDPDSGTWTATVNMVNPRHSHAAVLLPDGKVLVAGGHAPGDEPTDSAELYDPDTGSWTAIANMHAKREAIEAFLQSDGKVLVMGGSYGGAPQSVELYDPATGTWTASGDTFEPGVSGSGSATLLSDGMVLVRGRGDPPETDVYDPGTGSWTTVGTMLRSDDRAPATLLLDGTVLVAGGAAAELYVPAGVSPPTLPDPLPTSVPTPTPTPTPTPVPPMAGPVPADARSWTITVVNKSSRPATLFVAEEDARGLMGRLVGSVTPNVVPPGATVKVTFLVPANGSNRWWIFANPGPNTGPMFGSTEVSLVGVIRISADGSPSFGGL